MSYRYISPYEIAASLRPNTRDFLWTLQGDTRCRNGANTVLWSALRAIGEPLCIDAACYSNCRRERRDDVHVHRPSTKSVLPLEAARARAEATCAALRSSLWHLQLGKAARHTARHAHRYMMVTHILSPLVFSGAHSSSCVSIPTTRRQITNVSEKHRMQPKKPVLDANYNSSRYRCTLAMLH